MRGEEVGIYRDVPTRNRMDLSGTWEYSSTGETWNEVKIPASMDFEARTLFRRKFKVTSQELSTSAFKFVSFGINHDCEVFINGTFIGRHVGGYTAFEFPVPIEALDLGDENVIQISVSNVLNSRTTIPLRKHVWGWRNYGGLVRDLFLLVTPRLWIDDVQIFPTVNTDDKSGSVRVKATISNKAFAGLHRDTVVVKGKVQPMPSRVMTIDLIEKSTGTVVGQTQSGSLTFEENKDLEVDLTVNAVSPRLWSTDTPELYNLRVSIEEIEGKQRTVLDQWLQQIGFTARSFDKQTIRANGQEVVLKGVVWHEEAPGVGASLSYEQMEKDVASIKSLGANAVRFAFHPPHPYVVELCARYGLYALEEIPIFNAPAELLTTEGFQQSTTTALKEMIGRDAHNPAVLAWGLGTQIDGSRFASVEFVRLAVACVRTLDARPVYATSGMVTHDLASAETGLAAIAFSGADLKTFKRILTDWKKSHAHQPVVITAYGKEVEHANRNGWSDPMSQEAQARFFLQYVAAIKEAGVAGSFVDAFADWRGDRPVMTVNQENHYIHPLGLTSEKRERRLAYDMVRTLYNGEKTTAIPVGSFRPSFPLAHVLSGLFVIILLAYQYTYNRRFGEAVKRSLTRSYNFYADLRDSRAVSLFHTMVLAVTVSITLAVILSSVSYFYRTDKLADYLISYFMTWDALKERFIDATWHPVAGIAGFALVFFVLFAVFAVIIKLCGWLVRARVTWFHAFSVAAWGAMPIVFLSPVAMSLFKVMENTLYVIPSMAIVAVFLVWTWFRLVSGVAVIYDVRPARAYVGALLVCLLLGGGALWYYESTYAILAYAKLALDFVRNSSL